MKIEEILEKAPISVMPKDVKPMMATLVAEPFDDESFIFEVKWDGYRTIAEVREEKAEIYSRNLISFNHLFPEIKEELEKMKINAVFDGEIVVLDKTGFPNFEMIQNFKRNREGTPVFYVFDVLFYEGRDLRGLSLLDRKKILKAILPNNLIIKESTFITGNGNEYFLQIKRYKLEGMVAKKKSSKYLEGKRTMDWQKIKTHLTQDVVIGGYTKPRGGRVGFGSLILGVYENGKLIHIGNAGGGLTDRELLELKEKLQKIEIQKSPFIDYGEDGEHHWVEPIFVGEVKFAQWTRDGHMRQPIFLGLREDKTPPEVTKEIPRNDMGN